MQVLETLFSFRMSKIKKDAWNKTSLGANKSCIGCDILGQMLRVHEMFSTKWARGLDTVQLNVNMQIKSNMTSLRLVSTPSSLYFPAAHWWHYSNPDSQLTSKPVEYAVMSRPV